MRTCASVGRHFLITSVLLFLVYLKRNRQWSLATRQLVHTTSCMLIIQIVMDVWLPLFIIWIFIGMHCVVAGRWGNAYIWNKCFSKAFELIDCSIFPEYFRSTDWVWLILSQNSIESFSSGPIVVIHMKCNHHIEHDTQSPFGTSMQMNGDAPYRSTKAKSTKKL